MMNNFNPNIHHRRSIRLKGYDYSQAGLYFVTICCQDRLCRFGSIRNGQMVLNELGRIAHDELVKMAQRFPNFELDVFQIMPNHVHAIILLKSVDTGIAASVGAGFTPAQDHPNTENPSNHPIHTDTTNDSTGQYRAGGNHAHTDVSDIVRSYKSLVSNVCLSVFKARNETMGKLWQRNYYEHIIRSEQSYQNISQYIVNNPAKWQEDRFYAS